MLTARGGDRTTKPQYGREHRARRKQWQTILNAGPVMCSLPGCGRLVYAEAWRNWDKGPWQLGHGIAAKHGGLGVDSSPQHHYCNESQAQLIAASNGLVVREW